jgi:hypothetical protein
VDGQEFAALPQTPVHGKQSMHIYSFGTAGKGCVPRTVFDFASGKTIFGFSGKSNPQTLADLAYEYRGQIWWFHRGEGMGQGQRLNIAPFEANQRVQWLANAFPGITRDGRIIYAATRRECFADSKSPCTERVGYVIADPYQSHAYRNFIQDNPSVRSQSCITHGHIQREREAFARMHGLASPK